MPHGAPASNDMVVVLTLIGAGLIVFAIVMGAVLGGQTWRLLQ